MIDNEIVAKTITALRNARNMTQQQFAAILGVSHQAVSKWETGAALPDLESMLDITHLFGITMEQLLSGNIPEFEQETESEKESSDFLASIMGKDTADEIRRAFQSCRDTCSRLGDQIGQAIGSLVSDDDEEDDGAEECNDASGEEEYRDDETEESTGVPSEDECVSEEAFGRDEAEETPEDADSAEEETNGSKMSLRAIIELAPFMGRKKTTEMVLSCGEPVTPEALRALAPFLTGEGLEELLNGLHGGEFSMDDLIAVAPFLNRETLFRLAAANADKLDIDTLKRLAPFLRKSMVDGLVEVMQRFAGSEFAHDVQDFGVNAGKTLSKWGSEGIRFAKDAFVQFRDAAKATCDEFKAAANPAKTNSPAHEQDDALREKILRAALEAGNWEYLRSRISAVPSSDLLTEICAKALAELPYKDAADIVLNALPYLNEEGVSALTGILVNGGYWDIVVSAAPFAGTEAADIVLTAALGVRSEASLEAAKAYSKRASRETLSALSEKAIAESAWDFIAAIDSAI